MGTPANGLQTAVVILQLVTALEPAAVELVKTFLASLQGKTTEQILSEADSIWQNVVNTADQELKG